MSRITYQPFFLMTVFVAATVIGCQRASSVSWHLSKPLPKSATLVNSFSKMFGPDASDIFEFEVTDGELLELLIAEWKLQAVDKPSTSFAKDAPPWWPIHERLCNMPLKYEFFDEGGKIYKSVWTDPNGNRLYAEVGDW